MGETPPEILKPPEIWQREKFGQLILMRISTVIISVMAHFRENVYANDKVRVTVYYVKDDAVVRRAKLLIVGGGASWL